MIVAGRRTQAVFVVLLLFVYRVIVCLRSGDEPWNDSARTGFAGGGRRSAAAVVAIDSAGDFPSAKARDGDGGVCARRGGRTGVGADVGRVAYGYLLLAMGVLHQHSGRRVRSVHDLAVCGGSTLYQERTPGKVRRLGTGLAGGVVRMPADHPRQGEGS